MLFVGSIEKLCECGWIASKNADVCQRSGSCGSSLVFLRHIYEQSCVVPRRPYFRLVPCCVRYFSRLSGFSGVDFSDIPGALNTLLT